MTGDQLVRDAIDPALSLLPDEMSSTRARALLVAIAAQESGLTARRQIVGTVNGRPKYGPARGLWQFERAGGVAGVLEHRATRDHAARVLTLRGVPVEERAAYQALSVDDIVAAAFARLLLWTDPRALPYATDSPVGWLIYLATWRPGKPRPETWARNFRQGWEAVA